MHFCEEIFSKIYMKNFDLRVSLVKYHTSAFLKDLSKDENRLSFQLCEDRLNLHICGEEILAVSAATSLADDKKVPPPADFFQIKI
jgi:hypothetical protein